MVEGGHVREAPFLDITDRVGNRGNEQGLLGLAFHPGFARMPYVYVNYTDRGGNTVIARYSAQGNSADPASERVLLRIRQPFANHNGGEMTFGPDGYLYIGLGDGGSQGDPLGNAQNTRVLLGKILRIDVDSGAAYGIPPGNPYAGSPANAGGLPEVWAYGLRNPWRFSFDKGSGDLYIADVGQNDWEEVDFVPAGAFGGANFGWNYFEGNHPYAGVPNAATHLIGPIAEYRHADGGCAIIGGYVYRGELPTWRGIYLFGDNCSGKIWGLIGAGASAPGLTPQVKLLFETGATISSFGQDQAGEVYLADLSGSIYRLEISQP